MAPDLNSVPHSPPANRSQASNPPSPPTSRRPSQMTGTPLLPGVTSSGTVQQDTTTAPLRHPRPLTAAELHLELEKEQEAVVNRLTRELSALRAQHSASVASTASSSSAIDNNQPTSAVVDTSALPSPQGHLIQGPPQYTPSRRHRSSSNLSNRSNRSITSQSAAVVPNAVASSGLAGTANVPLSGTSQASVDRARDAVGMRSRENSLAGVPLAIPSRSRAPSVSPTPSPMIHPPGTSGPLDQSGASMVASMSSAHRQSVSSTSSTTPSARSEDTAAARSALEAARIENEALVARVKELEAMLRGRPIGATRQTSQTRIGRQVDAEREYVAHQGRSGVMLGE